MIQVNIHDFIAFNSLLKQKSFDSDWRRRRRRTFIHTSHHIIHHKHYHIIHTSHTSHIQITHTHHTRTHPSTSKDGWVRARPGLPAAAAPAHRSSVRAARSRPDASTGRHRMSDATRTARFDSWFNSESFTSLDTDDLRLSHFGDLPIIS